jgi:8-oxo-dGTP pyrophosphatase MutT (NUDIX family)
LESDRLTRDELVDAAVLVPVYRDLAGDLRLVLIRRAEGGVHGGQIAFPGGRSDPADASPLETALREAEEEIGLTRDLVHVLDALPVLETRSTGFRIRPFLARVTPPEAWKQDQREVAEVIEPRVVDLAAAESQGEVEMRFAGIADPQRVRFLRVADTRLWGVSLRILEPLLPRLLAPDFEA